MRFTKRRTEYLTRRWAAKVAVAHRVGLPTDTTSLARVEVRNAAGGAPEAYLDGRPAGVGVSLTDRAGWAVCLVSDGPQPAGCDLELAEPRSPAFVRDFLTEAEQHAVAEAGWAAGRRDLANLIWSAKESTVKVLRTGLSRDTRSVQVTLAAGPGTDGWSELTAGTEEGGRFPGWWCRHGPFLLTVVYPAPARPPVSIEDPPALAGAEPEHSWLSRPA
jgi:4'-phosphopantetheinyl transferase